jgi:hypothetical protein
MDNALLDLLQKTIGDQKLKEAQDLNKTLTKVY